MEDEMARKIKGSDISKFVINNNTYIMFIILSVIANILSPTFFTWINIRNIGMQQTMHIVISMGVLFVILTGGIDLSVGSVQALSSVIITFALTTQGWSMFTALALSILAGVLFGTLAGFLVSYMKLAPFVVTLANMTMARGIAYMISNATPVSAPVNTITKLSGAKIFGVFPVLLIIGIAVIFLFWFVQKYTTYGRMLIAIGSNEQAVRLGGIRVMQFKMSAYVLSGVCAAFGGIISASRTGVGSPVIGNGMELSAIAACVIGGARLSGGEGSVVKTVIGVLILAFIGNIMNLMAVPAYPQDVIMGIIILIAVLMQVVGSKKD